MYYSCNSKNNKFAKTYLKNQRYRDTSPMAQMVKNLPALQETWVQSWDWEDPLEKGMTTHSSFLDKKIPWTEELGRLQQRVGHDLATKQ